jgi:G:T-mismatch repair DNA endonuclease (very short patch repair protein)
MADVHTLEQRSFNMSRIKGKNTKPGMAGAFLLVDFTQVRESIRNKLYCIYSLLLSRFHHSY